MQIITKAKWLPTAAGGILLTLAFPKAGFSFLAWIALVPLFFTLRNQSPKAAFKTGMIFGLTHAITLLYWVVITMRTYGYLPWWQSLALLFLLAAYVSLYTGFFSMVLVRICHHPVHLLLFAPAGWVSFEFLRGFLFSGFPWGIIGYTQYKQLYLIQIADLFGVYGVSFVIVLFNAALTLGFFLSGGNTGRSAGSGRGGPSTPA
jgi:apolipoprotein N-acyltransferase